jgi:flagellar biosynthetic protein FlhB
MAEGQDESEKTEEPTPRRLEEARKKGDVPKSMEIPGWFVLASGLAAIIFIAPSMMSGMAGDLSTFLSQPHAISLDGPQTVTLMRDTAWQTALSVSLLVGLLAFAGLAGHLVQSGLLFSAEKIQPKIDKINPFEGVKRTFGPQGWVNFLKGVGKLALVSLAAFVVLWPKRDQLAGMPLRDVTAILGVVREAAIELLFAALAVYAVIAGLDFIFQKQSFMKRNRMSRREIKDELKQSEGDPLVRAKLRQIRQERAQKRMMADVPDATVVITNPTHYAIALKYEQGDGSAPVCVAKGLDAVALKIREVAKEHEVPIVEDPPLARALHASVDIDEQIPVEHFQAVAKVIGYVLSLSQKRARRPATR